MLELDGSFGEGGGQILRSALSLAMCTGQALHMRNIRAKRKKPGLRRQHLTAVQAACSISCGEAEGATLDSREVVFTPGPVTPGDYYFSVGTAGSATLVLQTVLYPLLTAGGESRLTLEGGTHNPWAPPFDFLVHSLQPLLQRMGVELDFKLYTYGFAPKGGGKFTVTLRPPRQLTPLVLMERGELVEREARALIHGIPAHVAERELATVAQALSWPASCLKHIPLPPAQVPGPGNVLLLKLRSENVTEVFTGFAQRGVPAETVARQAIREAKPYLAAKVAVGPHLADQLLLPLALSGAGSFTTVPPTQHTLTNIEVIQRFLEVPIQVTEMAKQCWRVEVGG